MLLVTVGGAAQRRVIMTVSGCSTGEREEPAPAPSSMSRFYKPQGDVEQVFRSFLSSKTYLEINEKDLDWTHFTFTDTFVDTRHRL